MWHQHLMSKIIASDPVLSRIPVADYFNRLLCPAIIREFADVAALGGDPTVLRNYDTLRALPAGVRAVTDEEQKRFSRAYPDQSLAAHIINGVFAGFRIAGHFPAIFTWDEQLWRIWILGFVLHDYGKAAGIDVPASNLSAARAICRQLGERLAFEAFFPDWVTYLDDIVFLAQNTQTVKGQNLNIRDFNLHLHPDGVGQPRFLASFADVLLHITEPRDVAAPSADGRSRHINLREKLNGLFPLGRVPRLTYHQVAEVRGLLTNILHNATQATLSKRGYSPYLYFANGVVYLDCGNAQQPIDISEIAEAAWISITKAVKLKASIFVDRANVGVKVAPLLYDLLDATELIEAGKKYTLDITNAKTRDRLTKFGTTDLSLADDVRCDRLAEFLAHLRRNVAEELLPNVPGVTALLLEQLELKGVVSETEAELQRGGTCYGWFYVASIYFTRHGTMALEDLPNLFNRLALAVLTHLQTLGAVEKQQFKVEHSPLREAFNRYVRGILDVDGIRTEHAQPHALFEAEIARYHNSKATNRAMCSLCSTPFESQEQAETVVLFKPQQYSTKNRLGGSRVIRGICPICSLEMLLRQAMQEAKSGDFQDSKAIYLALYPSYFFTPESAQLVKDCAVRLRDLNLNWGADSLLATLRRASEDGSLQVDALLDFEHFLSDDDDLSKPRRTIRSTLQSYSAHEFAGFSLLALLPQKSKGPTDTDAWILPAFYALALPLLLNVKTAASTSFVPLYSSASELIPTVVLDGMHPTVRLVLALNGDPSSSSQFRTGRLRNALKRLLAFYDLHTDVFAENFDHHWGQLGAVVRDVVTDPYNVFTYFDRKKRGGSTAPRQASKANSNGGESAYEGVSPWHQRKYVDMYLTLGGRPNMGIVGDLVTSYAQFYRAQGDKLSSAYSLLKPLATAIDETVSSPVGMARDDLVMVISGALNDLMERVADNQADGWDPIRRDKSLGSMPERLDISRRRILEFAELFVDNLFLRDCDGDRAVLRERANRLRAAARFYYLTHFAQRPQ